MVELVCRLKKALKGFKKTFFPKQGEQNLALHTNRKSVDVTNCSAEAKQVYTNLRFTQLF